MSWHRVLRSIRLHSLEQLWVRLAHCDEWVVRILEAGHFEWRHLNNRGLLGQTERLLRECLLEAFMDDGVCIYLLVLRVDVHSERELIAALFRGRLAGASVGEDRRSRLRRC